MNPESFSDVHDRRRASGASPDALLGDWFVRAGAGSGKTHALVSRVVALVDSGTGIDRIVAITFTEAAAAELRERIRRALGDVSGEASPETLERRRRALRALDSASIGTIHAFALKLLEGFALTAGLAPHIRIPDEAVGGLAFEAALRRFLDDLATRDGVVELMNVARARNLKIGRFVALAAMVVERLYALGSQDFGRTVGGSEELGARAPAPQLSISEQAWAELDSAIADLEDLVPAGTVRFNEGMVTLRAWRAAVERHRSDLGSLWPTLDQKLGNFGTAALVKPAVRRLVAARDRMVGELGEAITDAWRNWAIEFAVTDSRRRAATGALLFQDLLGLCRDLLRSNDVVDLVRAKYDVVLIDEFQDTDPLQWEIARSLAGSGVAGAGASLFLVGDGQQSIYRFRGASVEAFAGVETHFDPARRLTLTQNFRSAPTIVDWVNRMAGAAWAEVSGASVVPFSPMVAARTADPPIGPAVCVVGGAQAEPAAELRAAEVGAVAQTIARALDEGWSVSDSGVPGGWRSARPSDIAVLIPSRTVLTALEQQLSDACIPYRIEANSLVWASAEAMEVLALVRALADPADERGVVAALRSPGVGCSDRALLQWRRTGGTWSLDRAVEESADAAPASEGEVDRGSEAGEGGAFVRAALLDLAALRTQVSGMTVGEAVRTAVEWAELDTAVLGAPRPRDSLRRLRYVLAEADRYGEESGATLLGFCRWAERLRSDTARVSEPIVAEPDDPSVRILTIHAAKGLEFPIVVLAGMSTIHPGGGQGPSVMVDPLPAATSAGPAAADSAKPHGAEAPSFDLERMHVRLLKSVETPGYGGARTAEDSMSASERLRLLYVGCTRARDHLVVSAYCRPPAKQPSSSPPPPPLGRWIDTYGRAAAVELLDTAARSVEVAEAGATSDVETSGERVASDTPALAGRGVAAVAELPALREGPESDGAGAGAVEFAGHRPQRASRVGVARSLSASGLGAHAVAASPAAGDSRDVAGSNDALSGPWVFASPADRAEALNLGSAVHAALEDVWRQCPRRGSLAPFAEGDVERACSRAARMFGVDHLAVAARVRGALEHDVITDARGSSRRWFEVPVIMALDNGFLRGVVDLAYRSPAGLVVVDYKTDADVAPALAHYRAQIGAYASALSIALDTAVVGAVLLQLLPDTAVAHHVDVGEAMTAARAAMAGPLVC